MKTITKKILFLSLLVCTALATFAQEDIPFAVVEKTPVYPGCEAMEGKALKDCTVEKITSFVNKNFDTSIGKQHGLTGLHKVVTQFKIDENGNIINVRSRSVTGNSAGNKALEDEAIRVISNLPKMQPGEFDGKSVGVMYSLPIAFMVPEEENKNAKG